jgi:hypothetical protein
MGWVWIQAVWPGAVGFVEAPIANELYFCNVPSRVAFEVVLLAELKEILASTPQREDDGAQTNSRYHFQALCGLVLVLERHKLDDDYALVYEYHDDIAIFDNQCFPKKVQFYQVKSKKNGHWTPTALTKRDKKKGAGARSFLGKMYENVLTFGDAVEAALFLSNAPTNFAPSEKSQFCLTECDSDKQKQIIDKLKDEFSDESVIKSELLWVARTDLSLEDADTHAKGKLDAFVVDNLGQVEFSLSALFKAVSEECDSKSRATDLDLNDFDEVVAKRGITRDDANGWLEAVSSTVNCPSWEEIASELNLPVLQKIRLSREWNSYRVAVLNPNEAVRKVRRMIERFINDRDLDELSLDELLAYVFTEVAVDARAELRTATDERIKAMILYEAYSI